MYVFLALAGAAASGIGAALMKFGVSRQFPRLSLRDFLPQWRQVVGAVFTNKVWLLGFLLGVSSGFLLAQAMAGGDLSVVQILANTSSIWSVFIGVFFFTERLAKGEWVGLGFILAGAALVSMTHESTGSHDPVFVMLTGIVALVLCIMAATYVYNKRATDGLGVEFLLTVNAGLGFGLLNVFMKLTTWHVEVHTGSFNAVSASSWGHMVSHLPFWLMIASIPPALFFIQAAFSHGRVAVVMPLHIVFINITVILCAVLVYGESLNALRLAGIATAIAGAWIMARQSKTITRSTSRSSSPS